ncbi:MAG: DUF4395 domain-containing protein [Actinomycetota bacterium]|nr:DUF4395 domain-containing protein [Actinomycetota bacterium]
MEIDSRGPRFGAAITVVVLALVLITGSGWLLAAQVVVFAVGALAGLRYAPYGLIYRWLIRPRLGPATRTEAEAPPRFAQGVGMVIAAAGVLCYALGVTAGGLVFTALALIAAFLNAVFDLCLGCHMYLFIQRNQKVRPSA